MGCGSCGVWLEPSNSPTRQCLAKFNSSLCESAVSSQVRAITSYIKHHLSNYFRCELDHLKTWENLNKICYKLIFAFLTTRQCVKLITSSHSLNWISCTLQYVVFLSPVQIAGNNINSGICGDIQETLFKPTEIKGPFLWIQDHACRERVWRWLGRLPFPRAVGISVLAPWVSNVINYSDWTMKMRGLIHFLFCPCISVFPVRGTSFVAILKGVPPTL